MFFLFERIRVILPEKGLNHQATHDVEKCRVAAARFMRISRPSRKCNTSAQSTLVNAKN